MSIEVKEIIEELEKAVEPNDFGQGVVFAIQTIKGKYGIDDYEWEQDDERQNIPSVLFKDKVWNEALRRFEKVNYEQH